jgi:putative ABC transport system permease protein
MLRRKLVRDLRGQAAQAVAIAATLFLGAALFAATYDAYRNLEASYARVFAVTNAADLTVVGGRTEAFATAARKVPGVAAVETRAVADVPLQVGDVRLLGRVVGETNRVDRLLLLSGSRGGALAERHLAGDFRLRPGDTVRALGPDGWRTLRISGVVSSPEYLWLARSRQDVLPAPKSFGVVFAPPEVASALGGTREALVRYGQGTPERRLEALAARYGARDAVTRAEQPSNAALRTDIDGFRQLAVMFPLLFLAAAALSTGVLLSRRVRAERRLIGTLRASGAARRTVVGHYLAYGLVLGAVGGTLGAAAGELLAATVTRLYTRELSIPLAVTPARPWTAVAALAFALAIGALAALAPARAAAKVEPAEAMRAGAPAGPGGRSLVERLLPPLARLPVRYRHVLRSLGRSRRRSLTTMLGVVLATTLILVAWGMLDTTTILLSRQFGQVERQDATLRLTGPVDTAALARIRAVPAVTGVEPAAERPVTLVAHGRRYATIVRAFRAGTTMHGFPDPGATGRGLVLGSALRGLLHLSVGDRVQVRLADRVLTEPVSGFVDEPLGTYAYTTLGRLGVAPDEALARFAPGAPRAATLHRLELLPGVAAVVDTAGLKRLFDKYLGLFYAFVAVMLVFAAALAFAIMFTTISANLAERAVEVTTLRASGVAHRTLARLLRAENILLTAAGIVVGLPVAYLVARQFMAAYTSDLFNFDLHLRPWTPALAALALLAVALLSELPGLRALRRIDIARVVRERGD